VKKQIEKKLSAKELANEIIGSRFPLMSGSSHLALDIREDFLLTKKAFGEKYRRGTQARLEELQNVENRLAVEHLSLEIEHMRPITDLLSMFSGSSATLLDAASGVPVDEKKAEILYGLATIRLQRSLEVADYSLSNIRNILKQLKLDDLGVSIFRGLICGIDLDESALAIGARHKKSRQTVSERRTRLVAMILNLRENSRVMSLQTFMSSRIQNDKGIQGFSLLDPVVAISRVPNRSEFPNVVDVVLLGLWLSSADSASGTPKGLTATVGDRLVRR
jgi:hypothetical protein